MRPRAASVLLALALAAAGVTMPSPLVAVAAASSDDTQGDDVDPAPGPCEQGWVAPTPVAVAVDAVPVVVASTADDYFVLYVDHPNPGKIGDPRANEVNPQDIAVSVTRGEEGTTVLRDNLRALSPAKYRVEKYQVDTPGDLDGDCVDDITELDGFGLYNPLNPALKISSKIGRTAIQSHQRFVETSSLHAPLWRHRTFEKALIKFVIVDWLTSSPSVYFMDHSKVGTYTHNQVIQELRRLGIDDISTRSTLLGAVIHYPNVLAPDGNLGVYVYHFQQKMPPIPYFGHMNQLLASALPFLEDDLAFIPDAANFELMYNSDSAGFKAKRVNILLYEDKRHIPAYVPLNQAEGYGLLRLMGAGDDAPRPHEIPIYESLPNDLPRVAGSITTVPQTPLSHVNLRAIQNGVPNAFLRDILKDDDLKALIGKHVYFSVGADGFVLREATKSEVDAHHQAARPTQTQTPERDLTVTEIKALADVTFDDWDAFGVKAANMAELGKLGLPAGTVPTGYAVPFYFYDEFMKNAGLATETVFGKKKWPAEDKFTLPAGTKLSAVVAQMLAHPRFQADYGIQEEMLDDLRDAIKDAQSPAWIITALEAMHAAYPEGQSLRYRSSTNNEDLPSFNGAGLYSSKTQDPDETAEDGIDKSIKAVWASLWNFRAFLEREYHRVDHATTAMGVLVHPNFSDERVNGVAVSFDPVTFSPDAYYVNAQLGEDLVTNPEAMSHPEQLLLDADGKANVLARSNLAKPGQLLMSDAQMVQLRSSLQTVHDGFKTLYDVPDGDEFAIEIEFKITAEDTLAIKQARPWVFPDPISPPTVVPEVSVAAGTGVIEGADAQFTVSTSPAPSAPLPVSVTVTQDGDFGVSVFSGTVRVPTSGSVTVTVGTSDDDVDETDGSVTFTVAGGSGYTVSSSQGSASVAVSDDDDPPAGCGSAAVLAAQARANHDALPNTAANRKERNDWWRAWIALSGTTGTYNTPLTAAEARVLETGDARWTPYRAALECLEGTPPPVTPEVSVTAGPGVTEGADASFTVTASPAPSAPLSVSVSVAQSGDFGASTGSRTVTVPTSGTASVTVSTSDDDVDESDGSVSVSVAAGSGYTVSGTAGSASVAVSDDDGPQAGCGSAAVLAAQARANHDALANTAGNRKERNDWWRAWIALSGTTGTYNTPLTAAEARVLESGDARWTPYRAALECLEGTPPPVTPEVSVTAGSGITEGGDTSFTVTASPAPSAPLSVSVTVAQVGDFGVTTGSQTVTVPTAGSVTLTVSTSDDDVDELDGSVTVSVVGGSGYTVSGTSSTASVAVADDDDPAPSTPEISVTAGAGITEGGDASFTVTASPAPTQPLSVSVSVAQAGDFGVTTGSRTVTVPASGSVTVTVPTADDSADETDGSVTVTVASGDGYTVSSTQGSATVGVSDDDDPPPVTPEISVTAGSGVTEGGDASFTVSASPAPAQPLSVSVTVSQQGDYGATTGSRTVTIGTGGSATVTVSTSDDGADEADGSVSVTVNSGDGYTVSSTEGSASVVVSDDDDPPPADLPQVSVADGSVTEGAFGPLSLLEFSVTLSEVSDQDVTVRYTIRSGTALNGLDYWGGSGQVTIWAGFTSATIGVNVKDDTRRERDETLTVELTDADGAVIADGADTATGTIIDND